PKHGADRCASGGGCAPVAVRTVETTTTTTVPVHLDPDVAALPDGHGAKIAIGLDDAGYADTYLAQYLKLPLPLTISVIPAGGHAPADDAAAFAAGKQVQIHIPLQNKAGNPR